MNKLKLLIPTLSVATVAAGIFTTTSCSKSDGSIINLDNLTKLKAGTETYDCLATKGKMDYEKNKTYTVVADANLFKKSEEEDAITFGFIMTSSLDEMSPPINIGYKKIKVWAGEKELKELGEDDVPIVNSFSVHVSKKGEEEIDMDIEKALYKKIIKIEFQISSSVKQQYAVLVNM